MAVPPLRFGIESRFLSQPGGNTVSLAAAESVEGSTLPVRRPDGSLLAAQMIDTQPTRSLPNAALRHEVVANGTATLHADALTENNVVVLGIAGAVVGQRWTATRTDGSLYRVIYQSEVSGETIGTLDRPNDNLYFYFDGADWVPQDKWQPDLEVTLEQFEPNAGQGDATVDTRALKAALLACTSLNATPVGGVQTYLANRRLKLVAPKYLINDYLQYVSPSFYNNLVIEGRLATTTGTGTALEWVGGDGFVMTGNPALQFDAAAKTISRLDAGGSWVADGCVVGMKILPSGTALNNYFFHVIAVDATTIHVDPADFMQNETTLAGNVELTDAMAFLELLGPRNTRVYSVDIILHRKVQFGLLHTFVPGGPGPISASEENIVDEVSIYEPRDSVTAKAFAIGVPPTNSAPSDCALIRYGRIQAFGDLATDYRTSTYKACAWGTLDGNNTKDFTIDDLGAIGFRRGVDWERASGTLSGSRWFFEEINEVDCDVGNGTLDVQNWITEGSRAMLASSGSIPQASVRGLQWFGETADDSWLVVKGGAQVELSNFVIFNNRCERTITAVSTVDGTITYAGEQLPAPTNPAVGLPLVMRGSELPAGFFHDGPAGAFGPYYYASDFGGVPGAWTCKLHAGPAGAVVVPTTVGVGTLFLASLPIFQCGDFATSIGSLELKKGQLGYTSPGSPCVFSQGLLYPSPLSCRIPVAAKRSDVYGYAPGGGYANGSALIRLPDWRGTYEEQVLLQPGMNYYPNLYPQAYGGIVNSGTVCYVVDARDPGVKGYGGATLPAYLAPQPRCVIKAIRTYVARPFAGPGLTAAQFSVDDYNNGTPPGPIAGAFLLPVDCMGPFAQVTDRRKGFVSTDYGPDMREVIVVPANAFGAGIPAAPVNLSGPVKPLGWAPLYADPYGNVGWTGQDLTMYFNFTLTGCAFSALTDGRLEIYLDLERIDDPANV